MRDGTVDKSTVPSRIKRSDNLMDQLI